MVFNILVDNTDDHEKNHSILVVSPWSNGRFRLAPAYDVLSSNSGQGFQEFICGDMGRDSTLETRCPASYRTARARKPRRGPFSP